MGTDTNSRNERTNSIKIFLTVFLACAFFTNNYLTTNDASRFSLTIALVERGSGEITGILDKVVSPGWRAKDFAIIQTPGIRTKIFSDKAPLGSFLAVPIYWAGSRARLPIPWVIYLTSLLTAGMMTALTSVLIYRITALWRKEAHIRILVALTYGMGTMALFYGSIFFSGAITAFCGFAGFYCLLQVQTASRPELYSAIGGFLAGAAVLSDYYAGITAVCLIVYGLSDRRRQVIPLILGFAVPIGLLFLYNDLVFGAPWPLSYAYSNLFAQLHSEGFYGVTKPGINQPGRLAHILFAFKGPVSGSLLSTQPIIAVDGKGTEMICGFFVANFMVAFSFLSLRKFFKLRRESLLILAMSAGYLYLNASESWLDAYSARFFMPLLPFLFLPMIFLDMKNSWMRGSFYLCMTLSIIVNFLGVDLFLPAFMNTARPGMQNIAAIFLEPKGIELWYGNFIFLFMAIAAIWLSGRRSSLAKNNQKHMNN